MRSKLSLLRRGKPFVDTAKRTPFKNIFSRLSNHINQRMKDMPYLLPRGSEHILEVQVRHKPKQQATTIPHAPTKVVEPLKLVRILGSFLLLFFTTILPAQKPTPWPSPSEVISSDCTTLLDMDDDGEPYGYTLNEEWISINGEEFIGFWLHSRFFVPEKGIVLTIMDCGVTYDQVPNFGNRPITESSTPLQSFFTWKSKGVAAWSRHIGYSTAFVAGITDPSVLFLTGVSLSTAWHADTHLRWWEIPLDLLLSGAAYQLGYQL